MIDIQNLKDERTGSDALAWITLGLAAAALSRRRRG